jgi:hypothetical protein
MWYKLNNLIGVLILISIVGGAVGYVLTRPPLLRQKDQQGEEYDGHYQRQARKDMQRRLDDLQEQSSKAIQDSLDMGRRATGS